MRNFAEYLIEQERATRENLLPCTPTEVAELRQAHGGTEFPFQYEEFLLTMGRRSGDLLRGSDFFYPHIVDLLDEARGVLIQNGVVDLIRPGSIIIGMHQGYQVFWLEPGSPSGKVHMYEEMDQEIRQSWPTLLDFLTDQAQQEMRIQRKFHRSEPS